jgi:copper homeostasis protein
LEICAFSVADAVTAIDAGADRIELCRAPDADGLTPSDADLFAAAALLPRVPVHPIIRPRAAFEVTPGDLDQMCRSIAQVAELGFPGAVVGMLVGDAPDWSALREVVACAPGLALTFHRAFDLVGDQRRALTGLADLGFSRVLTSGRPGRAVDNLASLASLAEDAADAGVVLMAGGGVASSNAAAFLDVGIRELHASAGGSAGGLRPAEVRALAAICRPPDA